MFDRHFGGGNVGADLLDRRFTLGPVADRHHDVGTRRRESFGQAESQAAVGAGHHRQPARKIGHDQSESVAIHHVTGNS